MEPSNKKTALLHSLVTFFKSYSSTKAHEDILEARQTLGGLGYSAYSRLQEMIEANDTNLTWEGDNKVLLQQTAKFLLKNAQQIEEGKAAIDLPYLNEFWSATKSGTKVALQVDFTDLQSILKLFQFSAA